jgi:fructose-bisphosphate aldolase class I
MNAQLLTNTARAMVADDKGLLAMDESNPTCAKRFAKWGFRKRKRCGALTGS